MRLIFIFLLLICVIGTTLFARAQQSKPVVVQNSYFPKTGKEKEVYEWRLHASDVRAKLGLPKGRVLRKISENTGPYVIWECDYPSLDARQKDVEILDRSDEFKKVQDHMSTLLDKFERTVWEVN